MMADEEQKVVKASVRVTLVLNPSDFFAQVGTGEYEPLTSSGRLTYMDISHCWLGGVVASL